MMRWFAAVLVAALLLLASLRPAFADPTAPVVVVDLRGALDDPEGLRAAIGTELRATAVPPDDPRAAYARHAHA